MRIFRSSGAPATAVDPATFVGPATVQRLANDQTGIPVAIYRVSFEDGGRTNWHSHSGPQWLLVIDGRIRVQRQGEPAHDLEAGDAVVLAPGEKHWHGATPGSSGTHLAVSTLSTHHERRQPSSATPLDYRQEPCYPPCR